MGQRELDLETGSTGQASVTQQLLTSLNTALVYSLPLRVGRSSRRNSISNEMMRFGAGSYEFVGFSFLSGQGCDPLPDWDAWERAENSLEVSAASTLRTQGGTWCVQAPAWRLVVTSTGWRSTRSATTISMGEGEKGMLRSSPVP